MTRTKQEMILTKFEVAKFMGFEYKSPSDETFILSLDQHNYDRDWNQLMAVVEKIESLPQKSIRVQISGCLCDIIQTKRDSSKQANGGFEDVLLVSRKHNDKRFLVWESVVEFVKLHNKNGC